MRYCKTNTKKNYGIRRKLEVFSLRTSNHAIITLDFRSKIKEVPAIK